MADDSHGEFRTPLCKLRAGPGRLNLRARLRTDGGEAKVFLHLIADGWNWRQTREITLAPVVQTFELSGELPAAFKKSDTFFVKIDLPRTGEDVICERLEVWRDEPEPGASRSGVELFTNADFLGGGWGYMRWYPHSKAELSPASSVEIANGVARPNRTSFRTCSVRLKPDTEYTVAARVRSLVATNCPDVRLTFVDGEWHAPNHRTRLRAGGDWQEVRFVVKTVRSVYNRWYLFVNADDPAAAPIEIDRVSLAEGRVAEFPPLPDGELLPDSTTLFDAGRGGVFRVLRRNAAGRAGVTELTVRDPNGRVLLTRPFPYGSEPVARLELPVPADHPRGVFEVSVPGAAPVRYCVARDLSARRYAYNPHAGHFYPHSPEDLRWYRRYMPIVGSGNRAFCSSMVLPRDPAYLANVDALGHDSILVMPNYPTFSAAGYCPWTDEVRAGFTAQCVEAARLFRGHRVAGVELFNEPFLWRIRTGADAGLMTMPAAKVAKILADVVPAMKAANPELRIVGPCCALKEPRYLEEFLAAGGGDWLDAVSIHSYTVDPDADDFAGLYRRLRAIVRGKLGKDLPVYNTEAYFGVRDMPYTRSDVEAQRGYFRDTERSHASFAAAMIANHAAEQVSWCNFGPGYFIDGLTETDRPYPFVALPALNAAIEFLADGGFGRELHVAPGVRCFLFAAAKGGPLATIRSRLDTDVTVSGFGGLLVFDQYGNRVSADEQVLRDEQLYVRFASAAEAERRLKALSFRGLEAAAARERPRKVRRIAADYSADLSFAGAGRLRLGKAELSRVFTPGVVWRGEADLSAMVALVWNETGLKLRVGVRDDAAVYPDGLGVAFLADSLQVYFDQKNDATPASEEGGKRREDDIVYNIAAVGGKRPGAYVSFANGSRYLGAANETTGVDLEVKVEYRREGDCHVYDVFFPKEVFPDLELRAGAVFGFSLLVNDADVPGRRGQGLTLSSSGAEPYDRADEYLDLELKGRADASKRDFAQ